VDVVASGEWLPRACIASHLGADAGQE